MTDWKEKVVIIMGAGLGIGRSLAVKLARKGAVLVLADINARHVQETAETIKHENIKTVTLDVSDKDAVKELVDDTYAEKGRLDYIFNKAWLRWPVKGCRVRQKKSRRHSWSFMEARTSYSLKLTLNTYTIALPVKRR